MTNWQQKIAGSNRPYSIASPAPTKPRQDFAIVLVHGPTDTGRSNLALTAPGPMCYTHCSELIEGMLQDRNKVHVEKFGYEIGEFDFSIPLKGGLITDKKIKELEDAASKKWDELTRTLNETLKYARTTVIDTATEAYLLMRYAWFGNFKPSGGRIEREWAGPNQDWYKTFHQFRSQLNDPWPRSNLIIIEQDVDEWTRGGNGKMGKKTGKTVRSGQNRIPFWSDIILQTNRELRNGNYIYTVKVEKPWKMKPGFRDHVFDITDDPDAFGNIMTEITGVECWNEEYKGAM